MSKLAVLVVTLAIAQPVFAQTPSVGTRRPVQSNPYGKLFDVQPAPTTARALASRNEPPKRSVVCGLTIISGDPQIDPKFSVAKKRDDVEYTLTTIDPPTCKP